MKSVAAGFALSALVLAVFFAGSENYRLADGPEAHPYVADFVPDYVGAWIVRFGDTSRLYDPTYYEPLQHDRSLLGFEWDARKLYPLLYPPHYYAALTPLAGFEYPRAAKLFAGALVLCWALAAVLALRGLPSLRPWAVWLLPASLLFPPWAENLASGQKGAILLLLFTAAFALWRRGMPLAAGAVFGLVAFKPHLGVVLGVLALWKREWAFAAGAATSAGALLLLGAAVGPGLLGDWAATVTSPVAESARYFHFVRRNQCWYGFAELLLGADRAVAVTALTAALNAVTGACLIWLWRGPLQPATPRFAALFSGAVLATVLVSPHALTYDLTLLLLPLALLLDVGRAHPEQLDGTTAEASGRVRELQLALAALFLLCGYGPRIADHVPVQLGVPAMFAVLALLAVRVRGPAGPATGAAGLAVGDQTSAA